MNKLPLELKIIGTVSFVVLALLGFNFKDSKLLAPNQEEPSKEVSKRIPTLTSPSPIPQEVEIKILVININNKKAIKNAEVKLIVSNGSPETKETDGDGYASFTIPKGVKVRVFITKEGFEIKDKIINETIDKDEVKIYSLTPERKVYFSQPSSVAVNPSLPPKPSTIRANPIQLSKSSSIAINPPPPPKTLPTEDTKQQKAFQKNYNNLELVNKFQLDIFF